MKKIKVYVPFQKKDSEERVVEGYATSEALDSQGEIIKIEAIKQALPEYMKFANIREMHQMSAVGKAVSASIDETKKAMYLVAKVVDDVAWKKVKEGVYNGFSIGGYALKKVNNIIEELILNEISLVDRPANPAAVFSLYKSEDAVEAEEEDAYNHKSVYVASHILELTKEIVYLCEMYMMEEKDTSALEKIIASLKAIATAELSTEQTQKLADLINNLEKRKAFVKSRNDFVPNEKWTKGYFEQMRKVNG